MRLRWRRAGFVLLGLLILFGLDWAFYQRIFPPGGYSFDSGRNGLWVRDSCYLGKEKETITALSGRLKSGGFRDCYFHVRFIEKSGKLHFQYPERARALTMDLHRLAPGVRAVAWVYAGNERGLTGIDLSNTAVRRKMVEQAKALTTTYGFDGVQWDYEICADGDGDFLKLLEETRQKMPKGKLLSVASPMWLPAPLHAWGWSEDYFSEIAKRCDQIAVMAYDSGMPWPRGYVWLLKQQCVRVPRAAQRGNPQCRVLMGLPTYEDGGVSHSPWSENLELGLKAVREAGRQPGLEGIALFADYTTDAAEWRAYRKLWHGPGIR